MCDQLVQERLLELRLMFQKTMDTLPDYILLKISQNCCNYTDIVNLSLTCTKMRSVVRDAIASCLLVICDLDPDDKLALVGIVKRVVEFLPNLKSLHLHNKNPVTTIRIERGEIRFEFVTTLKLSGWFLDDATLSEFAHLFPNLTCFDFSNSNAVPDLLANDGSFLKHLKFLSSLHFPLLASIRVQPQRLAFLLIVLSKRQN